VNDRRSFEEFVELGLMKSIPDATTVGFFRERLRKTGVIEELIEMFEAHLRSQGLQARGGQIIDANFVQYTSNEIPAKRTRKQRCEAAGRLGRISKSIAAEGFRCLLGPKKRYQLLRMQNSICVNVYHGFICRYTQLLPIFTTARCFHAS
jgi:IS5 family transposase